MCHTLILISERCRHKQKYIHYCSLYLSNPRRRCQKETQTKQLYQYCRRCPKGTREKEDDFWIVWINGESGNAENDELGEADYMSGKFDIVGISDTRGVRVFESGRENGSEPDKNLAWLDLDGTATERKLQTMSGLEEEKRPGVPTAGISEGKVKSKKPSNLVMLRNVLGRPKSDPNTSTGNAESSKQNVVRGLNKMMPGSFRAKKKTDSGGSGPLTGSMISENELSPSAATSMPIDIPYQRDSPHTSHDTETLASYYRREVGPHPDAMPYRHSKEDSDNTFHMEEVTSGVDGFATSPASYTSAPPRMIPETETRNGLSNLKPWERPNMAAEGNTLVVNENNIADVMARLGGNSMGRGFSCASLPSTPRGISSGRRAQTTPLAHSTQVQHTEVMNTPYSCLRSAEKANRSTSGSKIAQLLRRRPNIDLPPSKIEEPIVGEIDHSFQPNQYLTEVNLAGENRTEQTQTEVRYPQRQQKLKRQLPKASGTLRIEKDLGSPAGDRSSRVTTLSTFIHANDSDHDENPMPENAAQVNASMQESGGTTRSLDGSSGQQSYASNRHPDFHIYRGTASPDSNAIVAETYGQGRHRLEPIFQDSNSHIDPQHTQGGWAETLAQDDILVSPVSSFKDSGYGWEMASPVSPMAGETTFNVNRSRWTGSGEIPIYFSPETETFAETYREPEDMYEEQTTRDSEDLEYDVSMDATRRSLDLEDYVPQHAETPGPYKSIPPTSSRRPQILTPQQAHPLHHDTRTPPPLDQRTEVYHQPLYTPTRQNTPHTSPPYPTPQTLPRTTYTPPSKPSRNPNKSPTFTPSSLPTHLIPPQTPDQEAIPVIKPLRIVKSKPASAIPKEEKEEEDPIEAFRKKQAQELAKQQARKAQSWMNADERLKGKRDGRGR